MITTLIESLNEISRHESIPTMVSPAITAARNTLLSVPTIITYSHNTPAMMKYLIFCGTQNNSPLSKSIISARLPPLTTIRCTSQESMSRS